MCIDVYTPGAMHRELIVALNGREVAITVEPTGADRWRAVVDGQTLSADVRQVRPGTWSLIIDGRSYLIDLDRRQQETSVTVEGQDYTVTVEDARRRRMVQATGRGGKDARSGEILKAPIAGKVVKVLVSAGDAVVAGQGMVILEAMKMENQISCEGDGVVTEVHVEPGQSVDNMDKLVSLSLPAAKE